MVNAVGYEVIEDSEDERIGQDSPSFEMRPQSKGRLYLNPSDEEETAPARQSPRSQDAALHIPAQVMPGSAYSSPGKSASARNSPNKNIMADSIPLRTSSLRHSSSSPAPMKRKHKQVHRSTIADSPFVSKRTEHIADTSFLDLGEDDETVKRIMELRKRREIRLLESTPAIPVSVDLDLSASNARGVSPSALSERSTQEVSPVLRPQAQRVNSAPVKAHKMLGITIEPPVPSVFANSPSSASRIARAPPELGRLSASPLSSFDHNNLSQPASRPASPPQLSLDYSYAHAVDALRHGAVSDSRISQSDRLSTNATTPRIAAMKRESLGSRPPLDIRLGGSITNISPNINKCGEKDSRDRWTTFQHPDPPPAVERRCAGQGRAAPGRTLARGGAARHGCCPLLRPAPLPSLLPG